MILYCSTATSYIIYDRLFKDGFIKTGYQSQKFNHNLMMGLAKEDKVISLSALPYANVNHESIKETIEKIDFYCIKNKIGVFHKFYNIKGLYEAGKQIIKGQNSEYILCDAIASSPSYVALKLGKKFKIPVIAIVTDIPEVMCTGEMGIYGRINAKLMKRYDGYILLTEQMNEIVNIKNKPYMIMEGSCGQPPKINLKNKDKNIILYSGSLWKENAGLEYLTEGFIKANLPNAELHFYGTGEFKEDLKEIQKKNPSVKYMGCITNEEMVKKQLEATLLVNPRPSNQEFCKYSFPSKTFEYMVSGTPVLMTKLPGIGAEYFEHVYTIDEETSDGVCKILKEIFSKENQELQDKALEARKFILENKNYIMQAKRIIDFLKENVGDRGKKSNH